MSKNSRSQSSIQVVDTFNAWIEKEARLLEKKVPAPSIPHSETMPVNTFEEWIRKQVVKEEVGAPLPHYLGRVPNTYEEWILKQVEIRSKQAENLSEETVQASSTDQLEKFQPRTSDLVEKPISKLANPDIRPLLDSSDELEITVTGRKSGRSISTPVWFVHEDGKLLLLPVSGSRTQWFKNVQANPTLEISIGKVRKRLEAKPSIDLERVKEVEEKFRAKYGVGEVKKYYYDFDACVELSV